MSDLETDHTSLPHYSLETGQNDWRRVVTECQVFPGGLMQVYVYCCIVCAKTYVQCFSYVDEPVRPGLCDWKYVKHKGWVCNDHKVEITLTIIDESAAVQ